MTDSKRMEFRLTDFFDPSPSRYNDDGIMGVGTSGTKKLPGWEYEYWLRHALPFGWQILVHNTRKHEGITQKRRKR